MDKVLQITHTINSSSPDFTYSENIVNQKRFVSARSGTGYGDSGTQTRVKAVYPFIRNLAAQVVEVKNSGEKITLLTIKQSWPELYRRVGDDDLNDLIQRIGKRGEVSQWAKSTLAKATGNTWETIDKWTRPSSGNIKAR